MSCMWRKILSEKYDQLCQQIIQFDPMIRFAGVANSKGELVSGGPKDNIDQILTTDEMKMSIHYALQKRDLYTNLAYRFGHERSAITEYDKVSLISIPINSNDLFMISTEPRAEYLKIIDYVYSALGTQKDTK